MRRHLTSWMPWVAMACVAAVTVTTTQAQAQAQSFELPSAGCPMAHCDARLSDQTRTLVPSSATMVAMDPVPVGGGGLGCVSNLQRAACAFRGDPTRQSNLVIYDREGQRLWEDGGQLGWQAWFSAPIIGTDGTVIAADDRWLMRVDPASNTVLWKSAKPDPGTPISPVILGSGEMIFLATKDNTSGGVPAMSVWDSATGTLLAQMPIRDPASGHLYITRNTPAVSGLRAYVVASRIDDETDGRLYAVDVCDGVACGPRGTMSPSWFYAFKGPSGASPLRIGSTIFFDGRPTARTGSLMAVRDRGTSARRVWQRQFKSTFGVSPAHDPRGGLWVHFVAPDGLTLMRLREDNGSLMQEINASTALGVEPGYVAHSVTMIGQATDNAVVLMFGAQPGGTSTQPTYVAAVDVSASVSGALLWKHPVGTTKDENAAGGQFPVLIGASGARRIIFQGSKRSTFVVGEP
jgi:PQQ-like domain